MSDVALAEVVHDMVAPEAVKVTDTPEITGRETGGVGEVGATGTASVVNSSAGP